MPHNHGHDVRDEHRNTENFAKGAKEHAPNDNHAQGLETAGESSGMSTINIVNLNDETGAGSPDGTTYLATDGPDIFVYDFSTADENNDTFEIYNFDASEDTLIFINAEVPIVTPIFQTAGRSDEFVYNDEEAAPPFNLHLGGRIADGVLVYTIAADAAVGGIFHPNYFIFIFHGNLATPRTSDGVTHLDFIFIYEDNGTTLAGLTKLDYPDDTTDPTPDAQFAHVYEGDPLADGLLA